MTMVYILLLSFGSGSKGTTNRRHENGQVGYTRDDFTIEDRVLGHIHEFRDNKNVWPPLPFSLPRTRTRAGDFQCWDADK